MMLLPEAGPYTIRLESKNLCQRAEPAVLCDVSRVAESERMPRRLARVPG